MTDRRVIVTKRRTYGLGPDAAGIPLQERYPGLKLPDRLKDARIYQTPDGPVIATPEGD